jgi:hypothetical protein
LFRSSFVVGFHVTIKRKNKKELVAVFVFWNLFGSSRKVRTLLSKLALCLSSCSEDDEVPKEVPMIIRFCGPTFPSRFSLNGLKLVQSISLQILAVYGKETELQE